jgi:N-acetyl-anhydromuramyl-L-alanine amidase AmpD
MWDKYRNWILSVGIAMLAIIMYRIMKNNKTIKNITQELPSRGEYDKRSLQDIDTIIVHHSASLAGQFTLEDFARWHIDPNERLKAPRIAYHFGIEPDGKIYQVNDLTAMSWHTINANRNGIGIELNGNFEVEHPTQEQMQSLKWLIKYLRKKLKKALPVYGHKEIPGNATSCPGRNFPMQQIR